MYLDFQGTHAEGLLLTLLLGVSAVLCAHGVGLWMQGRRRAGVLSLLAAGGPATAAMGLLIDAAWRFWRGDSASAWRSLPAGLLATVLSGAAGVVWERTGVSEAFWLAVLLAHVTTATMLLYASTYRALGGGRFTVLLALRLIAVAALLLILVKPVFVVPADADANKPTLAVLLDRSGSMAAQDQPDSPSRHAQAAEMLLRQARRLGETFRVQWFDFAATPATAKSAEDLARRNTTGPGTDATDIAAVLRLAGQAAPDAGVLLLSDGIANTPGDPAAVAESLGAPVYAVAVGSTEPSAGRANLQLLRIDATLQTAVDHATDISARIRMTRLANTQSQVQLFEGDAATPIATETISTTANDATLPVTFTWTPRKDSPTGVVALRIRVAPNALESTADDNEIVLHVAPASPAIRVLYIEGAVRPEYKYLHRLLQSDPNVQFAGLVRIRGNTFWSQGKLDGVAPAGLPATDEDFRRFDVLILGDLDASFLGVERMARIRRFVADGGGLLMLGGQSSFGPGGYSRSEVEAALPVVVGGPNQPQVKQPFVPQLTALGVEHPIFAGIAGFFSREGGAAPDATLTPLPALQGCVSVPRAKPGAAVLAVHPTQRNDAGLLIVLAAEPFGAGRSAALTADTTWRWYLPLRAMGAKSPYARFWGQLIRWLAGAEAVTRRDGALVLLRAERTYTRAGEAPVSLQALVRNADGTPAVDANVTVTLQPKVKTESKTPASILLKAADSPGLFEGEITPAEAGEFVLALTAADEKGDTLGTDELPLKVLPTSSERDQTDRNDALLHAVADRSKGQFVELSALPNFLDALVARRRLQAGPPPQAQVLPLYNFPALFVIFVLLLTTEWILRRRRQLQ